MRKFRNGRLGFTKGTLVKVITPGDGWEGAVGTVTGRTRTLTFVKFFMHANEVGFLREDLIAWPPLEIRRN